MTNLNLSIFAKAVSTNHISFMVCSDVSLHVCICYLLQYIKLVGQTFTLELPGSDFGPHTRYTDHEVF
jgi:hypothetical protein